ncbi:MAG TPA: hypothetical protein VIH38_14105, partial [Steroidobacteraceae bacterium]
MVQAGKREIRRRMSALACPAMRDETAQAIHVPFRHRADCVGLVERNVVEPLHLQPPIADIRRDVHHVATQVVRTLQRTDSVLIEPERQIRMS